MNNINERMAKVMGWQLLKEGEEFPFFVREYDDQIAPSDVYITDTEIKYWVGGWHPDTSIEQAMMCVNKAFGAEYSIDISFYKHQVIVFYKGKPIAQAGFVGEDTLPLAICEAILEAKDE